MVLAVDLKREYGRLYREAEQILASVDRISTEVSSNGSTMDEAAASESVRKLRSELMRLSQHMDHIKVVAARTSDNVPIARDQWTMPLLVGGIALGLALGKLWGSKSQVDSLPFWLGLQVALRQSL